METPFGYASIGLDLIKSASMHGHGSRDRAERVAKEIRMAYMSSHPGKNEFYIILPLIEMGTLLRLIRENGLEFQQES